MYPQWVLYGFLAVVFAIVSAWIGERKGRRTEGFVLGIMLGPVGLIITVLLDDRRFSTCPRCKKNNLQSHAFCCHCGADIHSKVIMCPHCSKVIKL